MGMLCCGTCEEWKDLTDFHADPRRATKRKKDCKVCVSAKRRSSDALKAKDRKRKAEKYADPKWRKEFNDKRKLVRAAAAVRPSTQFNVERRQ